MLTLHVAGFLTSAVLVVLAGTSLARHGDVIAARTRLGGLWVGSVLLAVATSLPEITTDLSAVWLGEPDLAAGDLFGSSMANMLILAIVSLAPHGEPIFRKAALDHALYATLAIIMSCIAAIFILVRLPVSVLGFGVGSIVLAATYGIGSRAIFRHSAMARHAVAVAEMGGEPTEQNAGTVEAVDDASARRRAIYGFLGASLVILLAAPIFARTAAQLAEASGLGTTFFGTWLVGFATSLPELVTSLAAVRIGAYDLAVGNLFGSNALNMAMFAPLDLALRGQPLLGIVSPTHALSALVAIVLMAIALGALVYRAKGRLSVMEPSSALLILTYVAGLGLIYLQTARP